MSKAKKPTAAERAAEEKVQVRNLRNNTVSAWPKAQWEAQKSSLGRNYVEVKAAKEPPEVKNLKAKKAAAPKAKALPVTEEKTTAAVADQIPTSENSAEEKQPE